MSKMSLALILISVVFCTQSYGQLVTKAYYNMGRSGAVTFAAAPETLKDLSGNGNDLKSSGTPLFFADAPADKKLNGEGSVLFKGNASYAIKKEMGEISGKFILETWVKAATLDNNDDHLGTNFGVIAFGDLSKGYVIAQQGSNWVVVVDGKESYVMAPVAPEVWVHLALVNENGNGNLYVNGERKGKFRLSKQVADNFSLANAGNNANFNGLIYAARLSTYASKFDAKKYLLLDVEELHKKQKQITDKQRSLITSLADIPQVTMVDELNASVVKEDWLVTPVNQQVKLLLQKNKDGETAKLMLTNGLASRTFYIAGNIGCISFKNLSDDAEYIRAIKPEARVMLDSVWYNIGGLVGQPEKAYFLEQWCASLVAEPDAFYFSGMEIRDPEPRYPWQVKYNAVNTGWPPKGLHIIMHYQPPAGMSGVTIDVHYEMYEGMPVIRKWLTVKNNMGREIVVNKMECEVLAVSQDQKSRLHVESDYAFAAVNNTPEASGSTLYPSDDKNNTARFGYGTTHWVVDPDYNTWATHNPAEDLFLKNPHFNLLLSTLHFGPSAHVAKDSLFHSFSTFELLHDNDDQERQTLANRKLYRKLAPQVSESLLTGGITSQDPVKLKQFIDQMSELGFERLDVMAWPGISHDNLAPAYLSLWKEVAEYAKTKGIITGGYELQVASRGRGAAYDCIDPATGKPGSFFGQSVCIASKWQDIYYPKMWKFFDTTGLMSLNVDGPYHGDACAAVDHPHHHNYYDSQWEQWKFQTRVIHELQRRNMYTPMPDWYFLNGQAATGMGYREASANLTPQQQLLLGRQYIYDGTWHKAPTMGWMTLQLVGFYSNDPRIGLEPLSENMDRYEVGLFQHLASGCQFTVRGNRLYDTPETKAMVKKWTGWFKKYRSILTSDIIHIGRPTGRNLDAMFHVNPELDTRGMAIIFNPTDQPIKKNFRLPLYYTGLKTVAKIREQEGAPKVYTLNHNYEAEVPVEVPAGGFTWLVVEKG